MARSPTRMPPERVGGQPMKPASQGSPRPMVLLVGRAAEDVERIIDLCARGLTPVLVDDESDLPRLNQSVPQAARETLHLGNLVINLKSQEILIDGNALSLSRREVVILQVMGVAPEIAWSFDELLVRCWGEQYLGQKAILWAAVSRLRNKLARARASVRIVSVGGFGFRLVLDGTDRGPE